MWAGLVLLCLGIVVLYVAHRPAADARRGLALLVRRLVRRRPARSTVLAATTARPARPRSPRRTRSPPASVPSRRWSSALAVATGLGWRPALLLLLPVVALLARRRPEPWPMPRPSRATCATTAGLDAARRLLDRLGRRHRRHRRRVLHDAVGRGHAARPRPTSAAGAASAGVTALVAGMCLGRVVGGRLALRFAVDRLLYGALAVNAIGFAAFWLTTWAPSWPSSACSSAASASPLLLPARPVPGDRRVGRPAGPAPPPASASARRSRPAAGPFVLGALADALGIHAAILVVPALLVDRCRRHPARRPRTARTAAAAGLTVSGAPAAHTRRRSTDAAGRRARDDRTSRRSSRARRLVGVRDRPRVRS